MTKNFKDELNRNINDSKKYIKYLDVLFMFAITILVAGIIFLATIDLWN